MEDEEQFLSQSALNAHNRWFWEQFVSIRGILKLEFKLTDAGDE